jgi:hypothetical protein
MGDCPTKLYRIAWTKSEETGEEEPRSVMCDVVSWKNSRGWVRIRHANGEEENIHVGAGNQWHETIPEAYYYEIGKCHVAMKLFNNDLHETMRTLVYAAFQEGAEWGQLLERAKA